MAWTSPATPIAGTAITVAFYGTNIKDNLNWLRALTGGGFDPTQAGQILRSTGVAATEWTHNPTIAGNVAVSGSLSVGTSLAVTTTASIGGALTQGGNISMGSTRQIIWPTEVGVKEDYTNAGAVRRGVATGILYDESDGGFEWRVAGAWQMRLTSGPATLNVGGNTVATLNSANFTTLQRGGQSVATLDSANFTTLQQGGSTVLTIAAPGYTAGTYVGNGGSTTRAQTTGFTPKYVVVSGGTGTGNIATAHIHSSSGCAYQDNSGNVDWEASARLAADGFTYAQSSVRLNANGVTYSYVAFR